MGKRHLAHGCGRLSQPRSMGRKVTLAEYAAHQGDQQRIPGEQHHANLLPAVRTKTPSVTLHRLSLNLPSPQHLGWLRTALASPQCQTCEGPCSEVCTPGGQPEMADKACLRGNDFPRSNQEHFHTMLSLQKFLHYPFGHEGFQNPAHPFLACEQRYGLIW